MHSCRPQGATLRKVRSLKHTEIRPLDNISYVIRGGDCDSPLLSVSAPWTCSMRVYISNLNYLVRKLSLCSFNLILPN